MEQQPTDLGRSFGLAALSGALAASSPRFAIPGRGIDPEHVERVFEAFYKTKSSRMGMGLSICRPIIDAHGAGCGRI